MTDWNWVLHGLLDVHTHNKPHPHSQGHLGAHILSHKFDWTNPAHLHCSHPMALQIYAPYPPIYDEIFQRIL